jgi:hypothetical protein
MKLKKYFNFFMIALYILLGVFIIIFQDHFDGYSKNTMSIFGIIIILYGAFRFGKTVQKHKQENENS